MKSNSLLAFFFSITLLFGCKSEHSKQENTHVKSQNEADIIPISEGFEASILTIFSDSTKQSLRFKDHVLAIIEQFNGQAADTTIIILANLDSQSPIDTLVTRIFVKNDTVFLRSSWTRNNELLWTHELVNPYLWIPEMEKLEQVIDPKWITLTTAVFYAIPEVYNRQDLQEISNEMASQVYHSNNGEISQTEFIDYLENFEGQMISYGHPESREGIFIWYENSHQFIIFYSP